MEQLKLFACKLFKHEVPNLNAVIEKRHAVPRLLKKKVHWLKEGLHKRNQDYHNGYHYGIYILDHEGNLVDKEWHNNPDSRDRKFDNYYRDFTEI